MATEFLISIFYSSAILWLSATINAQRLESPCPRLFVYEPPGNEPDKWYGIVTLISDSDLSGVWLRLIFDRPSLQLGNWFGEVKTDDHKDYLVKNRNHKLTANTPFPLRFFIKYDTSQPVPRLMSFRLNAKTVCPEGATTTSVAPAFTQLYTNKESDSGGTSPLPPVESPPQLPVVPRPPQNRPNYFPDPVDEEDDYFPGDFSGFNVKPIGVESNVECGTLAVQPRPLITYGQKTKEGEFPWHAALYHSRGVGLNYICGGSLISRYHVITVAHCVSRSRSQALFNPDNLLIYLGKYYLKKWSSPGIQDHQVSRITRHPQYDSKTYSNDIAVIKLAQQAEFTDYVRPVCLWEGSSDSHKLVGKFGTVVGWGFDENGKLTEELTMLNMPIVAKETCIYSFPEFYSRFTTSETFCAGFTNGTSVCNGDSGGGMVLERGDIGNPNKKVYHLRGLVSISVALQNKYKCDPTHYVVFTDVAKYLDFIKQAMI